ncbi:hypothetical protein [Pontixanthobacter luteolus]|uniref:hypothetical protein n=1 Tax=Pontixanthobacter luteolus TaxID=295089 RepID=UPI003F69B4B1
MSMLLVIAADEFLNPAFRVAAGDATIAKVKHEAGIMGCQATEFGCGHPGLTKEFLDIAD